MPQGLFVHGLVPRAVSLAAIQIEHGMKTENGDSSSLLDWGVAAQPLAGQTVCGDVHLVQPFPNGVLVAVVDGLGHGEEAARVAQLAVATLQAHPRETVVSLLERCHGVLRQTRGAVLTVASFNGLDATMTWVGVGSVEGVLLRAEPRTAPAREDVLLYGGVVGSLLPSLQGFVLPVARGDTLLFATDGIRSGFTEGARLTEAPQAMADRILAQHVKGTDDALVLVARYRGGVP
jgi:hypothetical protein